MLEKKKVTIISDGLRMIQFPAYFDVWLNYPFDTRHIRQCLKVIERQICDTEILLINSKQYEFTTMGQVRE